MLGSPNAGRDAPAPRTSDKVMRAARCPGWLAKIDGCKAIWKSHASDMAARRVWKPQYQNTLARYCVMQAQYQTDPTGFSAARIAAMLRLETALKLTPESEARRLV
jgi:phage terminase small subunit